MLPEAFNHELAKKRFTNGREDHPLVSRLYGATFSSQFRQASRLIYRACRWGDDEAAQIAAIAATGALMLLEHLDLNTNLISDAGACALLGALEAGHLPKLTLLNLADNRISEEGTRALISNPRVMPVWKMGENGWVAQPTWLRGWGAAAGDDRDGTDALEGGEEGP
jgi:hypothetical protein